MFNDDAPGERGLRASGCVSGGAGQKMCHEKEEQRVPEKEGTTAQGQEHPQRRQKKITPPFKLLLEG